MGVYWLDFKNLINKVIYVLRFCSVLHVIIFCSKVDGSNISGKIDR